MVRRSRAFNTGRIGHLRGKQFFYQPADVDYLMGDFSKTEHALGWESTCDVTSLARMTVENDLSLTKREKYHRNFNKLEARIAT